MAKAYERKLTDFTPDEANANKHTPRGQSMLETGLRKLGAGRSILVDKNNKVIAGNLTQEVALDIGLTDAIVVPTDGTKLLVHQRIDIDLDTPEGRELAVSDNRIAQVSIDFDGEVLAGLQAEQVDLSWLFYEPELAALTTTAEDFDPNGEWRGMPEFDQDDLSAFHTIKVHFESNEALLEFARLLNQPITQNTRSIYYPKLVIDPFNRVNRVNDES